MNSYRAAWAFSPSHSHLELWVLKLPLTQNCHFRPGNKELMQLNLSALTYKIIHSRILKKGENIRKEQVQLSELCLSDTSACNTPGALGRGHQDSAALEKIPGCEFGIQLLLNWAQSWVNWCRAQQFQEGLGESLSKHPPPVFLIISILRHERWNRRTSCSSDWYGNFRNFPLVEMQQPPWK